MEALECSSCNDSIPLYESYMRSFNIVENCEGNDLTPVRPISADYQDLASGSNNWLGSELIFSKQLLQPTLSENKCEFLGVKPGSRPPSVLLDSVSAAGSATEESNLSEAAPASSEDSKSQHCKYPKPVVITSLITMENSNNAVDSVPLFKNAKTENLFKLPISELSFNGTIKNIQKLKPIVDPMAALTLANMNVACEESSDEQREQKLFNCVEVENSINQQYGQVENSNIDISRLGDSTGDSQYDKDLKANADNVKAKWLLDQSNSSLEASFDSGVRSPDMFTDNEDEMSPEKECNDFKNYRDHLEAYDKQQMTKMETILQGVLPPPSVTIIKTDVTEMLKKYYCFLPAFTGEGQTDPSVTAKTPTKLTSYVKIPTDTKLPSELQETTDLTCKKSEDENSKLDLIDNNRSIEEKPKTNQSDSSSCGSKNSSFTEKKITLKLNSEVEAKGTAWPDILKCRFYDVYYNSTAHSERIELLALRYGERFVGAETAGSVGPAAPRTPGSAAKRKMMRLKMAAAKSPGRRLSHLARRRQAFCSAATINEKALASTSKMVLIDKNFFPHRKLITSADRKSPRLRRTPGGKTPGKKTPGKKTPGGKTPGGSSRKKAMRRLLMDPEQLTRSQPTRETSRRALFVSPEHRPAPPLPSTSVPLHAMKSKRALFSSPDRQAETKSSDGSASDQFLKRKRDPSDSDDGRSKMAKSLSFGGDSIGGARRQEVSRRASEMFTAKSNMAELDEQHRKKLLWAVSEALRLHGWRMQSPGFRDKASQLARLTRRLLMLPPHAARLASPQLSTSETLFKIARQHVFAIIQGRTVDECFREEKDRLQSEAAPRPSGYVSAAAYAQLRRPSQVKENTCQGVKPDQPKSNSKNILQDKLLNVDDSSSGLSLLDNKGLYKSNSMPTFEEAAKMRARRQISFDNVDFPKR